MYFGSFSIQETSSFCDCELLHTTVYDTLYMCQTILYMVVKFTCVKRSYTW